MTRVHRRATDPRDRQPSCLKPAPRASFGKLGARFKPWAGRAVHALTLAACLSAAGCATPGFDYTAYRLHWPRSILVLPPRNESTIVEAPYVYLSTITRPLAECGYYVFPVAVIDAFMKENGLPTADEMHGVSLEKIRDIIGADAVLYVTIEDWGQKYMIVQSVTVVNVRAELVDVETGEVIWKGEGEMAQGSGGGGDPIVMLVAAVVQQVISSVADQTRPLSRQANYQMATDPNKGFLVGPYRPAAEAQGQPASDGCRH